MTTSFVFLRPGPNGLYTDPVGSVVVGGSEFPIANGFQAVDDPIGAFNDETVAPSTADYVRLSSAPGARWSFKFQTPAEAGAHNVGSIIQVTVFWVTRRANVGTGATIHHFISSSGTISDQFANVVLSTSYVVRSLVYTTDPKTGIAWDPATFRDQLFEAGIVRADPAGGNSFAHMTQLYAKIDYNVAEWSTDPPASGTWSAEAGGTGGWATFGAGADTWTRVP